MSLKINLTSIPVNDQLAALAFYTEKLGFIQKHNFPIGEAYWITVVSPSSDAVELLLEPNFHPASKAYQKALFDDNIPIHTFGVDDLVTEYDRLVNLGVEFVKGVTQVSDTVSIALLNDTCGRMQGLLIGRSLGC